MEELKFNRSGLRSLENPSKMPSLKKFFLIECPIVNYAGVSEILSNTPHLTNFINVIFGGINVLSPISFYGLPLSLFGDE